MSNNMNASKMSARNSSSSTTTSLDEYELMGDAKYRSYVQQIDKALKGFEYTSEWADLVNALGKLNKVLQNNNKYNVIPRRFTVGQRLAQCMHPALPSGVHLKALETYDLIFKCIGTDRLIQELSIYSNGLFPLLSHAGLNVKPALLEIYETHFVPLGQRLRPALDGFLIAVLPGLEEGSDGSDHHERTNKLLVRVCEGVTQEYFYGSLWRCILNNPSVRLPATTFIISHFNKKRSLEDQLHIMGTCIPTLITGICAALLDINVLVQRAVLDLLLCCFPMHNCQILRQDMINITTAALTVLLRRDLSLNRRFTSWILGLDSSGAKIRRSPKSKDPDARSYFHSCSKELVLEAFKICLISPSSVIPIPNAWSSLGDLWPYRLLICILDIKEISSPLIDNLSIEILRALYQEFNATNKKWNKSDLLRTTSLLFTNIGIDYLWERISKLFALSCSDYKQLKPFNGSYVQRVGCETTTILEMCAIVDFILENVSVENYIETSTYHLSEFLLHLFNCLIDYSVKLSSADFLASIKLCSKIVSKIKPAITQSLLKKLSDDSEEKQVKSREKFNSNKLEPSIKELDENEAENCNDFKVKDELLYKYMTDILQSFFSVFVQNRFVQNHCCLNECFTSLRLLSPNSDKEVCLDFQPYIDINQNMVEVYTRLCQLLIEMSSIPTLSEKKSTDKQLLTTHDELRPWIQQLLVLALYTKDSLKTCYSSISTVLELITITKAVLLDVPIPQLSFGSTASPILEFSNNDNISKGNKSIGLDSMITVCELTFMYYQTSFFVQTTSKLWDNLGDGCSHLHLETATLLQQLHNLAVDSSVCESVICSSMITSNDSLNYDARKRFTILYNISRDLKVKSMPNAMIREFDRPLFFILDSLTHKVDVHNAQAIDWLNQSLKSGDIARILEPLLFILLHPDTSRLSVQHANIHQPSVSETKSRNDEVDNASIANSEAKIYAISSTGGNVIYHINQDGRNRFTSSPLPSNKVLTLTQTANNLSTKSFNRCTTQKVTFPGYEVPLSHEQNIMNKYLSINMFLNPFGSMSSLNSDALENSDSVSLPFTFSLPNLSNIKRLDSKSIKSDEIEKSPTPYSTPLPSRATTTCSTPVQLKKPLVDDSELTDYEIISILIEELIDKVILENMEESDESEDSLTSTQSKQTALTNSETISVMDNSKIISMSQLHSHMLLYQHVYDSRRTLYALSTIYNIILAEPQLVLFSMATTSISNRLGTRSQELQSICARHKNSMFGKGFYSELQSDSITSFRSSSFLEVIFSCCMYFIRSYYPSLPQSRLNEEEILGNQKVRILSCEVLRLMCNQLIVSIKGRPTFSTYLHDMLMRCKVQKGLLQCVVSSVYNFQSNKDHINDSDTAFADAIIEFNEKQNLNNGFQEDFQKCLLKLLEELMVLEHKVAPSNLTTDKELPTHNRKGSDSRAAKIRFQTDIYSLKFYPNFLIPAQSMFLYSIQTALQQSHKAHLHANWLALVESTLPFACRSLSRLVVCVITQLCHNLENCANKVSTQSMKDTKNDISPNYIIVLLKSLSTLCHYCLLDTSNAVTTTLSPQPQPQIPTQLPTNTGPLQVISSIFHVFSASDSNQDVSSLCKDGSSNDPILSTRKTVLTHLPRILSSLLVVWKEVCSSETNTDLSWQLLGNCKDVRQSVLSFLSPISLIHGSHFMASVAIVWHEIRDNKGIHNRKQLIQTCSREQSLLVELVAAIRVLPMESVLQTIRQAIKQPPNSNTKHIKRPSVEVSMLQFFLAYIKVFPGSQLLECWKSVLALLKDGLQISSMAQPLVQFHLLAILHEFVQAAPLIEDRKDQKDLQDVAQKLVDACTNVAGARLGQSKWLRRNLAVLPGPQHDNSAEDYTNEFEKQSQPTNESLNSESCNISEVDTTFLSKFSVQALCALAEFVAPVLDVVYVSEEKEKVVPLVANIMYYITPYLKNHSRDNSPSFRACSHLLSNISGYQYTRKAWRKDAFELLLDSTFFQIDSECFSHWKTIVDHLMTHDKTTFRDFLSRMSINQSGSALKIFSSKDQEIEQRANLVKRLAFILFCSERDQYQKYMSEIQEKLIESLRLSASPLVQAQVLLCFRVIILRMSAHHLTSLWPFIYTEMFQVFLHIEMELMTDTAEFRKNNGSHIQRLANLDSSWVTSSSNGLAAHNNPSWMQLYLAACKLLDLAIAMPADSLPQFQMYRWAFVSGNSDTQSLSILNGVNKSALHPNVNYNQSSFAPFEPHVVRIDKLMNDRNFKVETLPYKPKCPLITKTSVKSLLELHPFFHTVLKSSVQSSQPSTTELNQIRERNTSTSLDEAISFIDKIVELDFLEQIPTD